MNEIGGMALSLGLVLRFGAELGALFTKRKNAALLQGAAVLGDVGIVAGGAIWLVPRTKALIDRVRFATAPALPSSEGGGTAATVIELQAANL